MRLGMLDRPTGRGGRSRMSPARPPMPCV